MRKKRVLTERRGVPTTSKEWTIIYSDLMTNLMLFFLMLFALTRLSGDDKNKIFQSLKKDFTTVQEKAKFREILKVEKETKDSISEVLSRISGISGFVKVNISEKYIKMRLPNPVLFDVGQSRLKKEGMEVLDQLIEILKPIHHEIVVEGHTDNQPLRETSYFFSNWELSGIRALSAAEYMISQGIEPRRVSCIAYGPYRPLVSNDTRENRNKNRRIEINIVREK